MARKALIVGVRLDVHEAAHPVVAQAAELRAGDLRSRRSGSAMEPDRDSRPGMASCFTRISSRPKLWITSLLDRWTSTGLSTGRVQLVDGRDVVFARRVAAVEAERVVRETTSVSRSGRRCRP